MIKKRTKLKNYPLRQDKPFLKIKYALRVIFSSVNSLFKGGIKLLLFIFITLGLSIGLVSAYSHLQNTNHIKLERIEFEGIDAMTQDRLTSIADMHLGMSLVEIQPNRIKQKMEEDPHVRSVFVEKKYPRILRIKVELNETFALALMEDNLFHVNRYGEIFKKVNLEENINYPILTGIPDNPAKAREELNYCMEVLNFLEIEQPPWSLEELSEIHINRDGNIHLYYSDMPIKIVVNKETFPSKIDGLKKVIKDLRDKDRLIETLEVNLNYNDGAIVSFK